MTTRVKGTVYDINDGNEPRPDHTSLTDVNHRVSGDGRARIHLGLERDKFVSIFDHITGPEGPHVNLYTFDPSVKLEYPDSTELLHHFTLNQEGQNVTAWFEGGGRVKITYSPRLETRG